MGSPGVRWELMQGTMHHGLHGFMQNSTSIQPESLAAAYFGPVIKSSWYFVHLLALPLTHNQHTIIITYAGRLHGYQANSLRLYI